MPVARRIGLEVDPGSPVAQLAFGVSHSATCVGVIASARHGFGQFPSAFRALLSDSNVHYIACFRGDCTILACRLQAVMSRMPARLVVVAQQPVGELRDRRQRHLRRLAMRRVAHARKQRDLDRAVAFLLRDLDLLRVPYWSSSPCTIRIGTRI